MTEESMVVIVEARERWGVTCKGEAEILVASFTFLVKTPDGAGARGGHMDLLSDGKGVGIKGDLP
jgi:hypothetical protein